MNIRGWLERILPRSTTEFNTGVSKIRSSNIKAIGYSSKDKILQVDFKNGSRYHYYKVPESILRGLRRAISKGKYLDSKVKGVYKYKRIH